MGIYPSFRLPVTGAKKMAYAKKASRYRYRRRRRYGRGYAARRWRYRNRRRYYRRRYKKREYKRIESENQWTYTSELVAGVNPQDADGYRYVSTHCYMYRIIGTGTNAAALPYGVDIPQGTGLNERIGAKITPARLKVYLTLAMNPNYIPPDDGGQEADAANVFNAVAFKFRFIVMQVKAGSGVQHPANVSFSNINPSSTNGRSDSYFFSKAFVAGDPGFAYENGTFKLEPSNIPKLYNLMTAPYRRGLGGQFKILKDKVYSLDSARGSFYTIKMKTKRPAEMVWVENRSDDNQVYTHPRNPIYLIIIPCPNTFQPKASCVISLRYEFAYTDN